MYSFEQLKIFVSVCDHGSFSAAARKLKRAQSGVSQSVSNLEIALNQQLFDRSGNTPVLTPEGKALLPIARSILLQQLHFDQKVAALEARYEHEVVLAVEESLIGPDLLGKLGELAERFPMTNIDITAASTCDIKQMVSEGKTHIGVVYADGSMQDDIDFVTLGYNHFITVSSPCHPLAELPSVKDTDLRNYRQLVQRSASGKEPWFSYAISTQVWYASSHQMLLALAEQGVGWTIVPEQLAVASVEAGALKALNIEYEPNGWMNTIDLVTTRRQQSGPVREAIIEVLRAVFGH
ncbi:LysR family transcriptional regulator [Photobacterium alginatilyticum]|uniref:LysR family transcriptional regulator n=1 Tax=Photobacterium alginatilyticum TaxID=1775171 RepID=UPI0040690AA1